MQNLEALRNMQGEKKKTMRQEIHSVEFWRAVISECLATFFFVFLVCGAHVSWPGYEPSPISIALTCGFAMATLVQSFGQISGGHVNPAVTFAMLATQKITPLCAALYITAQCGGAIAGCALLFGVTVPGHHGALGSVMLHPSLPSPWQGFGIEMVLTFVIVFSIFASLDANRKLPPSAALTTGVAYLTCSLAAFPSTRAALNPARALGPAFVANRWNHHWVYWLAPMIGGLLAGLLYEYIFDPKKHMKYLTDKIEDIDRAESSLHTPDEDFEETDSKSLKFPPSQYNMHSLHSKNYDNYRTPESANQSMYGPPGISANGPAHNPGISLSGTIYGKQGPSSSYASSVVEGATYGNGSLYEASTYSRPHSTVGSTYASIHSRGGSFRNAPNRLEGGSGGPRATKF